MLLNDRLCFFSIFLDLTVRDFKLYIIIFKILNKYIVYLKTDEQYLKMTHSVNKPDWRYIHGQLISKRLKIHIICP